MVRTLLPRLRANAASNDTFISYRRSAAEYVVHSLYEQLRRRHIRAFYDIQSIRSGEFEPVIFRAIEASPYFVLVLTPGTLDTCVLRGDWVRREIDHALRVGSIIVPVHTTQFSFDDFDRYLARDVAARLRSFQAMELPTQWFLEAVNRLATEFLVPVPGGRARISASDRRFIETARRRADERPEVTAAELGAQEPFERAYARDDWDDARLRELNEAIALNPRHAGAYAARGSSYLARGDLARALEDFDAALGIDPKDVFVLQQRSRARAANGLLGAARRDLDEAMQLSGSDPAVADEWTRLSGDVPRSRAVGSTAPRPATRVPAPNSAHRRTASQRRARSVGIGALVILLMAIGSLLLRHRSGEDSLKPPPHTVSSTSVATTASSSTTTDSQLSTTGPTTSSSVISSSPTTGSPLSILPPDVERLLVGDTLRLETNKSPVEWTSKTPDIATVDNEGTVRGTRAGTATIEARADGVSTSIDIVVVNDPPTATSVGGTRVPPTDTVAATSTPVVSIFSTPPVGVTPSSAPTTLRTT